MNWVIGYVAIAALVAIWDPLPRWRARRDAARPIDDIDRHRSLLQALEDVTRGPR